MKSIALSTVLCSILAYIAFLGLNQNFKLKTGDISFIGFNSGGNDNFSIRTNVDLSPNTTLQFTDSEWNGQKFGDDETNIVWNSGKNTIKAGTIIHFGKKGKRACVSVGKANNAIKISKKMDAIFAYMGTKRTPEIFLAAMSTNKLAYGTLKNTGLVEGLTAITFAQDDIVFE